MDTSGTKSPSLASSVFPQSVPAIPPQPDPTPPQDPSDFDLLKKHAGHLRWLMALGLGAFSAAVATFSWVGSLVTVPELTAAVKPIQVQIKKMEGTVQATERNITSILRMQRRAYAISVLQQNVVDAEEDLRATTDRAARIRRRQSLREHKKALRVFLERPFGPDALTL